MSLDAIRTLLRQAKVTDSQLGTALGIDRVTVNKLRHGVYPMRPLYEVAIRWYLSHLASNPATPWMRRQINIRVPIPKAVRKKKCKGCGGDVHYSLITRKRVSAPLFLLRCITHQRDPNACSVSTFTVDRRGKEVERPKFGGRKPKDLGYDRPTCPQCELEMELGKKVLKPITSPKGELRQERLQNFYCVGGRRGKPKHKRESVHCNSKGGRVEVARGPKYKKLSGLPAALLKRFPKCDNCRKPMARQTVYHTRAYGRIWPFLCRTCDTRKSLYDSGKEHHPRDPGSRRIRRCPEPQCGWNLVKAQPRKSFPALQPYVCKNYSMPHKPRLRYFHRRNGREYIVERRGGHWEAKPVLVRAV